MTPQTIQDLEEQIAKLKEQLLLAEKDASTDPLTGIVNRRTLERELRTNIADAQRNYFDLIIAEIDLDHFKLVNDTYGHEQGDVVLKSFARIVNHSLRDTDIFGRWGGEEFILILPIPKTTPSEDIAIFFKRLQANISGINKSPNPYQNADKLTVSIGAVIAQSGNKTLSPEQILRQVDAALYEAKKTRNTYIIQPYREDYLVSPVG